MRLPSRFYTFLCFWVTILALHGEFEVEFKPYTGKDIQKAREVVLKWHNIFRGWHNESGDGVVPLLTLNNETHKTAQEESNKFTGKEAVSVFQETLPTNMSRFNIVETAEKAVKSWYYEICQEEYREPNTFSHFSQLVWLETDDIGVGISLSPDGRKFRMAVLYSPTGNYPGEHDTNVMALRCPITDICKGEKPKYERNNPLEETACRSNKTKAKG